MARRSSIGIAVALGAVLLLWVLIRSTSTRQDPKTLRVGVVLPLTGDLATYGRNAKDGIELAEEELKNRHTSGSIAESVGRATAELPG